MYIYNYYCIYVHTHDDCFTPYRYEYLISTDVSVLQRPFTPSFTQYDIEILSLYYDNLSEVSEYAKLKFGWRIIKALKFSNKTRCNDSCIAFRDPCDGISCPSNYGLVDKILVSKNKKCMLLVIPLVVRSAEHQIPQAPCGSGVNHVHSVQRDRKYV